MRARLPSFLVVTIAAALAGCGAKDPCAGKSGTCISAHVDGNAKNLSSTRVTLSDGRMTTAQPSSGTIDLPAQFAILVSDPVPASPFTVQLDGLRSGTVVASDTEGVSLANGRGSVTFRLDEGVIGPGGGDGGNMGDMAVQNPPVVTGLDPVAVDEMQALSVDLSATDPLGGNVVLSASNLPGNAMFTPTGATGKLTWTPGYTDAGTYTVKITATPDDTARTATFDLVVTVKNAADQILIAGSPVTNAVPIGDFDKDGFGDLAVCTGDAAGLTGKYHIQILYGSATGLPIDAASGQGRVFSFDVPQMDVGGILYSCKGGDFDGDGYADIIFSDPANDYWNQHMTMASANQGMFTVIFGGPRNVLQPPAIFLLGTFNFGQHMGEVFHVGDFNNDGKTDIATVWQVNGPTAVLFNGGPRVNVMDPGGGNAQDFPNQGSTCGATISIAMVDFNKDGLADWVEQDPGINNPGGTGCTAGTTQTGGGLRVIPGRAMAPMLNGGDATTFTHYWAPTSAGNDRYHWGRDAAGCDVDNDGYGDIGLLPAWTAQAMQHGEVYYGSATGIVATANMPLGDATANSFDVPSMQPAAIGCFNNYKNGQAALAVSAMSMINGPGEIDLFAGRPLTKVGTLTSPSPSDTRFGKTIQSALKFDVDGDGKQDLVVTSDQAGWVIYGR